MWWHHKKVALTPVESLGLLEGELARVVGRALSLGEEYEAPHTARKCLAVTSSIEQTSRGGLTGSNAGARTNTKGPDLVARFAVDDGSGTIVVTPQSIKLEIELHSVSGDPNAPPQFGASTINRELGSLGMGERAHRNLHEGVLAAGDLVAIIGHVKRTGDAWELVATETEPLIVSTHADQLV
jgi:hypothetical protein